MSIVLTLKNLLIIEFNKKKREKKKTLFNFFANKKNDA